MRKLRLRKVKYYIFRKNSRSPKQYVPFFLQYYAFNNKNVNQTQCSLSFLLRRYIFCYMPKYGKDLTAFNKCRLPMLIITVSTDLVLGAV